MCGGLDLLPLGNGSQSTHCKQDNVEVYKGEQKLCTPPQQRTHVVRLNDCSDQENVLRISTPAIAAGRRDGHEHIVAGEGVRYCWDQAGNQRSSILPDDLIKALGPTQTLRPGLTEGGWLFIVQHCGAAVADTFPSRALTIENSMSSVSRWNFQPPYFCTTLLLSRNPVPEIAQLVPSIMRALFKYLASRKNHSE